MANHDIELAQAMKTSGVKGIDDIPAPWIVKRLKEISKFESGWTPESKIQEYYTGDIPWATIGDLPNERIISDTKNKISLSAVNKFNMRAIPAGTLLFSFKLSIGQVAFTACEMFTNEAIAAFRRLTINKDFAYYALPFFVTQNCKHNIYGAPLLNRELMLNSFIPVPPACEQQAIAEFLNRETSIIDQKIAIVSRKQRLLTELRKATIHDAVTKGLDKTVRMKNSTVNWMGEIPAPWRLSKLKNVCKLQNGDWGDEPDVQNEGIVCYRKADFLGNIITNGQTRRFISKKPFVEKYDILIEKSGGGDVNPVGSVAMVMNAEPAACSNFIARIRANEKKEAKYLFYFLIAQYNSPHIYNLFNQTTGIQNINMQRLMSCIYPSPPSWEQQEISEFLDRETELIDQQLALLTRQIELFREQRKALIHEVVTGKMRVI